ncbi:hypothetical protein BJF87_12570 [Gordonia sp. CNJ-863]|uniref:M15 family metallopeptidase n=1 Tax=Gordonia TaxID=2053 RepID=UPI000969555D|nr:M15 family metallopeptidase [Gordonia sp. CNJ-863]OLT52909.1 hypothetical protein BJF87_12570 [Gordonia sp. CNJ-863]
MPSSHSRSTLPTRSLRTHLLAASSALVVGCASILGAGAAAAGTSQNGYPLITQAQTTQWAVNGVNFWTAPGKPTELLREFVTWFDANVEPITLGNGDDWSWAEPALVPPTNTAYSNHGSGTAVDLNLEIHGGQGFSGTFTPEQTGKIRAKLASTGGQIVWGGEWSSLPDDPHFEVR